MSRLAASVAPIELVTEDVVPARVESAAHDLFERQGFSGTSLRMIAAAAQTDPSVILRHFGSKEQLFLRAISVDAGLRGIVDGPTDALAATMLRRVIAEADPGPPAMFRTLALADDRAEVRSYRQESASVTSRICSERA